MELKGARVVIIGASGGIGAATAEVLARQGARLCLASRNDKALREVQGRASRQGIECFIRQTDITQADDVAALMRDSCTHLGGIDVLVNCAGRGILRSVEDTTTDEMRQLFELHALGVLHCIRNAIPLFRRQGNGHLIAVGSLAAHLPLPLNGAYVAAKHAVSGLLHTLRTELSGTNIHVTLVHPGRVRTRFGQSILGVQTDPGFYSRVLASASQLSMERDGTPFLMPVSEPSEVAERIARCIREPVAEAYVPEESESMLSAFTRSPSTYDAVMLPFYRAAMQEYLPLVSGRLPWSPPHREAKLLSEK